MPSRYQVTGPECRGDRCLQRLDKAEDLRSRLRGGRAVAGDDHDATCGYQRRGAAFDIGLAGDRTVRRDRSLLEVDHRRLGCLAKLDDITLQPGEIEMGRAWR